MPISSTGKKVFPVLSCDPVKQFFVQIIDPFLHGLIVMSLPIDMTTASATPKGIIVMNNAHGQIICYIAFQYRLQRAGQYRQIVAAVSGENRVLQGESAFLYQELHPVQFRRPGWQNVQQAGAGRLVDAPNECGLRALVVQSMLHLLQQRSNRQFTVCVETEFESPLLLGFLQFDLVQVVEQFGDIGALQALPIGGYGLGPAFPGLPGAGTCAVDTGAHVTDDEVGYGQGEFRNGLCDQRLVTPGYVGQEYLGALYQLGGDGLIGSALVYDGGVVHMELFAKEPGEPVTFNRLDFRRDRLEGIEEELLGR